MNFNSVSLRATLRHGFAAVLMGLVMIVSPALNLDQSRWAIAAPFQSHIIAYQRDQLNYSPSLEEDPEYVNNDQVENAQRNLKSTVDTVRDKLNLDQPIAPETKEFFNDVKNKVKEVTPGMEPDYNTPTERGDYRY